MIYIPFIFFLVLLLWSIYQKGMMCSATLLLLFYTLISFGAIMIDILKLYNHICPYVNIEIETALVYCILLFLSMIPLLDYEDEKIKYILPLKDTKVLDWVVWFYVLSLVLVILATYKDIIHNIILLQTVDNMKMRFRMGDESVVGLSGLPLFLYNKWRFFGTASIYLCFYFFYSITFSKKSWIYNISILFGSMSCIYDGILHVDRSATIYWMMYFMLCFVLFRRFMSSSIQKRMFYSFGTILFAVIAYVIFINISRFSESGGDFAISYLGQSYINFSTFYQKLHLAHYSIANNFPFLNSILTPEMTRDSWNLLIEGKTGINTMVFSTFIGDMMAFIGPEYTVLWIVIFALGSFFLLRRRNPSVETVHSLFLFSMLYSVVYLGIFTTFFHYFNKEFMALAIFVIFFISGQKAGFITKA